MGAHNSVVGADQGFRAPSWDQESVVGCCAAFDGGDSGGPGVEVIGGVLEAHSGALAELSQVAGVGGGVWVGEQGVEPRGRCSA